MQQSLTTSFISLSISIIFSISLIPKHLLSKSLNDLENGKNKKIDVEVLRKIAEKLDLSLELLMKAAGYNQVAICLNKMIVP